MCNLKNKIKIRKNYYHIRYIRYKLVNEFDNAKYIIQWTIKHYISFV